MSEGSTGVGQGTDFIVDTRLLTSNDVCRVRRQDLRLEHIDR